MWIKRWDMDGLLEYSERTGDVIGADVRHYEMEKGSYVLFTDHEQVVAELAKVREQYQKMFNSQNAEITRLRAELTAKSKDAERYAWLRNVAHPDSESTSIHVSCERVNDWGNWYSEHVTGRFLDGSIDNAIAAMGEGNGR